MGDALTKNCTDALLGTSASVKKPLQIESSFGLSIPKMGCGDPCRSATAQIYTAMVAAVAVFLLQKDT